MDYKEMWCERYDEIKAEHPEWDELKISQTATSTLFSDYETVAQAKSER